VTEDDHAQHEQVARRDEDVGARDGLNVVLTMIQPSSISLKRPVETVQKHSPQGITGIVIRPRTGEILAMAHCRLTSHNLNTVTTNCRNA